MVLAVPKRLRPYRADGTFVPLPLHDVTTLTEAFRRAVLRLFVRRELMDVETAQGMLAWPHSGFHVHDGVGNKVSTKRPCGVLVALCALFVALFARAG